jgi:threonine synthase
LPPDAAPVTLGEGNTPLVWSELCGRQIALKLENLNPTGSFKDRGTAVLTSWLKAGAVAQAVEDSSGNAGSSFAAYASRSGIQSKIFVPTYASGPKRSQIERYGSQVITVPGPRSRAAEAVLEAVSQGAVYASHAYLPHGTAGIATIAYELVEQLGKSPGAVLMPVGHGSLLLGINLGFQALLDSGRIAHLPRLIAVQAADCSPLFQAYHTGQLEPVQIAEKKTIAEGVAIAAPYHGKEVLSAVRKSRGDLIAIEESLIVQGQLELARKGFDVETTSALIWGGIQDLPDDIPDPVVAIITGHGLKNA